MHGRSILSFASSQEGVTNDPGTEELLVEACEAGANVIGGCPYTDTSPNEQIARIRRRHRHASRLRADPPDNMDVDHVCRRTEEYKYGGRVAIGHVTKMTSLRWTRSTRRAKRLANAGVALTVLPSTDLYLMGRQ